MVKLVWENKIDTSKKISKLKEKYKNYFKPLYFKKDQINLNSYVWVNRLYWGDNLRVLYSLLNNFEKNIDLIYIDPPFFSGTNYYITIEGDGIKYDTIVYNDHWKKNLNSYLQMQYERLCIMKKLLSEKGLIFIHLDWHASHYVRVILDEVFGQKRFINNIVWYYHNKYSAGRKNLPRAHDSILVYSKSNNYTFNQIRIPRKRPQKQLKREMVNGVLKNAKDKNGHVIYRIVTDKKMDDVWKIPCLQPASKEYTGFPTQKHHILLERIIKIGSNEGDLVADFFCGSGTSLLIAEKLKRRWIGCDISEYSIYLTRKRILNYQKETNIYHPFEVLSDFSERKNEILKSGFFQKEFSINRKK